MDADDAESIENKMKNLDISNKKTLHLMEKQVSITTSNFKNIQGEMGNITTIQCEFEQRLKILEQQTQHFHDLMGDMLLNRIMLQIITRIDKLQQLLNEQYEILTALKLHILHPLLLSAEDLQTIYLEINNYEREHHIAQDNQITSQLITVTSDIIDNELWIQIQVPLIEPQIYSMYHAYELPTSNADGTLYVLDFESPYLLNNSAIQNYIELSHQNVKEQCKACETKSGTEVLACKVPQARVIGTAKTNCLINLFNKKEREQRSCKHKLVTETHEILTKLHQENAWLYFFTNTQNIMAQCKDSLQQIPITGAGVMSLTKDCRFSIHNYELPYVKNKNTTLKIHQAESKDLPILPFWSETWTNKAQTKVSGQIKITQHSEFHETMQKGLKGLEDLEKEINTAEKVPLTTQVQNHLNSSLIIVIALILTIGAIYRWKKSTVKSTVTSENQSPEVLILQTTENDTSTIKPTELREPNCQRAKTFERRRSKRLLRF